MSETLAARLGRAPSHEEMASALGLTAEQVRAGLADAARTVGPLDAAADALASDTVAPEEAALEGERLRYLSAAVTALPERMRLVVTEIYLEGKAVKDVAAALGLTSSAVSQQRSEALRLLRRGLEAHFPDECEPASPAVDGDEPTASVTPRHAAYLESLGRTAQSLRPIRRGAAVSVVHRVAEPVSLEVAG